MNKVDLIHRWFHEVWENGNMAVIHEMLPEVFRIEGMTGDQEFHRDNFPDLVNTFRSLTGVPRVSITKTVETGDWIATRLRVNADGPEGTTPLAFNGQMMTRFDGTLMAENYTTFDYLSLFEQLGQIPPDALAICMSGQKLTWN